MQIHDRRCVALLIETHFSNFLIQSLRRTLDLASLPNVNYKDCVALQAKPTRIFPYIAPILKTHAKSNEAKRKSTNSSRELAQVPRNLQSRMQWNDLACRLHAHLPTTTHKSSATGNKNAEATTATSASDNAKATAAHTFQIG